MSAGIVALSDNDLPELARFFARQTQSDPGPVLDRLLWLARNPARREDVPLGWAVTAGLDMAGAMLCIPHRYAVAGATEWFQMSSAFYVDQSHRGAGLRIFMQYLALGARFVLFASTANASSGALWKTVGARPIAGAAYEHLRPVRPAPLVEEYAARRWGPVAANAARYLALPLNLWSGGKRRSTGRLSRIQRAGEMAVPPGISQGPELIRDAAFCRWRYLEAPYPELRVFRFTDSSLHADGYIAVDTVLRGARKQIRALLIADIWGNIPAGCFPSVADSLVSYDSAGVDLLVVRCLGKEMERAACQCGFRRRCFEQPIGWMIDRRGVVPESAELPPAGTEML